jgi:tetratricopeptide (TPR) repeat protein
MPRISVALSGDASSRISGVRNEFRNYQFESAETMRGLESKVTLWFENVDDPVLAKTEYVASSGERFSARHTGHRVDPKRSQSVYTWTSKSVRAFAWAMVSFKRDAPTDRYWVRDATELETALVVKTLAEDIEHNQSATIDKLIPGDVRRVFPRGLNRTRSIRSHLPVRIAIDVNQLPHRNVTIVVGENELTSTDELSGLAHRLIERGSWKHVEVRKKEAEQLVDRRIVFQECFGKFGDAIGLLESKTIVPADQKRIEGFYKGQLLDWDVLAADADIRRDQFTELLDKLETPATELRIVCITGAGIGGKSTLAWRAAFTLQQKGAHVLHVRRPGIEELWPFIPNFVTRISGPVYVLVDDPFRDALEALRAQQLTVPLTVLATSRAADYRQLGLPDESEVPLRPFSTDELTKLLQKTGKTQDQLDKNQLNRLRSAANIVDALVVLLGEEAHAHGQRITDIINRLRDPASPDHSLGRAYEYICFTWQFFVSLPRPVLERLDADGQFYGLHERSTARDLIDYGNDAYSGMYHPVVTEKMAADYATFRNPRVVLDEIARHVREEIGREQQFLALLIGRILVSEDSAARAVLPLSETVMLKAEACAKAATTISLLADWSRVYHLARLTDSARVVVERSSALRPKSEIECIKLKVMWDSVHEGQRAFAPIAEWVERTGNRGVGLATYLSLLRRAETSIVHEALDQQLELAKERPIGVTARAAVLSLASARGRAEQRDAAIEQALRWLQSDVAKTSDEDQTAVYRSLVSLAKKRSSPEVRKQVIAMTKRHLKNPPSSKILWDGLIGLLIGTEWRNTELRELTEQALAHHPDDPNILRRVFFAFNSPSDEPRIRSAHEKLRTLVSPDRADFWLADWLHHIGGWREAVEIYERLEFSQEIESDDGAYVKFYVGWGDSLLYLNRPTDGLPCFEQAATASIAKLRKPSVPARLGQATCYWRLNNVGRAEDCFRSAKKAAERESNRYAVVKNIARVATRFGFFYCSLEEFGQARDLFDEAINHDETYAWNYFGAGCCAIILDQPDALPLLDRALLVRPDQEQWHNPNHWRATALDLLNRARSHLRPCTLKPLIGALEKLRSFLLN